MKADATSALEAVSDAVLGIAGDLSLEAVLDQLVERERQLAGGRYAALGVPDDEGTGFTRFMTAGMTDAEIEAMGPLPRTHGLLGAMLTEPTPYRTDDITDDPRFRGWWPDTHPLMRSFLGVPIVFKGDVIGAFYITDKLDGAAFTADDEELVGVLAAHAAVLIEHATAYEQSRELSVLDERNRLARELHDAVTQMLFSLRLTIETAASLVGDDADRAADELATAERLVDAVFAELRALVFQLRPGALEAEGLAATTAKHLEVVGRAHHLAVDFTTEGEGRLPAEAERELFRIVQEAVTNAVRHSGARALDVHLAVGEQATVLSVTDDGSGFDPGARAISGRRLGLTSMRERAHALGGRLMIETTPGSGTIIRVEVPVGGR